MVMEADKRVSKNNARPNSAFSGVKGLDEG
jgi:hypothetical protein